MDIFSKSKIGRPPNVVTLYATPYAIQERVTQSDLVVGAVLIPGAKAPNLIQASDLPGMRNGAVIVDVCIDQGGCVETSRPTNATLEYVRRLAKRGIADSIKNDPAITTGANVIGGKITHPGVADAFELEYVEAAKSV